MWRPPYVTSSHVGRIDLCSTVCKFKAHKRCAVRSTNNCKWTTLASIGNDIVEDEDGVSSSDVWLGAGIFPTAPAVIVSVELYCQL